MKELSPFDIFRAQWRATFKFKGHEEKVSRRHNWPTVVLILVLPVLVTLGTFGVDLLRYWFPKITNVPLSKISDPLLASLAILAGALITAFSLLASWRTLISEHAQGSRDYSPERWLLDTSCAHLLSGAYTSIITAVIIILGRATEAFNSSVCRLISDSLALGLCTHVVMSLVIALPGLYAAYVQLNDVDPVLNGQKDL
jgi:hypothetical protein